MYDPGDRVVIKPEYLAGWEILRGRVGEIVRVDRDRISGFDYKVRIDVPFLRRGRFFLNHEEVDRVGAVD